MNIQCISQIPNFNFFWRFADRASQYIYLSNWPNWCTKRLFYNKFISCLYMFRAPCAHHREVKIVLYSLWYHQTYRWPSRVQVAKQPVHETATYNCDDTRGCIMQFWPHYDEHMCSKHVEARNKLIVKQKFCASSWLITEIKPNFNAILLFRTIRFDFYRVIFRPF